MTLKERYIRYFSSLGYGEAICAECLEKEKNERSDVLCIRGSPIVTRNTCSQCGGEDRRVVYMRTESEKA